MNIGMTVTGAKEIEKMLHKLETKEVSRIARTETRQSQKEIMLPSIRENVINFVGGDMGKQIAKNLTVRAMTKMRRGSYGHKVIIKPTDAFVHISSDGNRSYIPNAIEYGHAAPNNAGGTKVSAPLPFQRKSYEEKRLKVADALSKKMVKAIERAARAK